MPGRLFLVEALAAAPITTVVAGGGYGKTTLAIELGRSLGIATAITRLRSQDGEPAAFVASLAATFRQTGLSDAALALEGAGDDPAAAIGRLSTALGRGTEALLIVVD